jgi:anti-anti-sigma factor
VHIDVRSCGAVDVLHVSGRMTGRRLADRLRAEFARLLEGDTLIFVLNLVDVADVDSGFLGELIACRERVRKRGGCVKLVLNRWMLDLLAAGGLDSLFEVFREEDDALDSFSPVSETAGIP